MEFLKMKISKLTKEFSVAYQIEITDIKQIKEADFATIICNRPDGEVEEMADYDDIEMLAKELGMNCYYIPLANRHSVSEQMIAKTKAAINNSNGPVLAYCRTGTRSTILWALANPDCLSKQEVIAIAANAGYDISTLGGI